MCEKILFSKALPFEAGEVYALYQSVIGTEYCVWNEYYPGMLEVDADIKSQGLYVLRAENGKIIAALSVVPENEMDEQPFWEEKKHAKEIARVAVAVPYRGRGLAGEMVEAIKAILRRQGVKAIHLSVANCNPPAYRTYQTCGFSVVGTAKMYGNDYVLMEYKL